MCTSESNQDTWLEDYRVAVQIGGGNNELAMKHLPLMLEGSATFLVVPFFLALESYPS